MFRYLYNNSLLNSVRHQIQIMQLTTSVVIREKIVPIPSEVPSKDDTGNSNQHSDAAGQEFARYTQEESGKILNIVNNMNAETMLGYEITKARASKLLAWQSRNGPLQHIEDILQVEGFRLKVVEKFFNSLLHGTPVKKANRARSAPFVQPAIDREQQRLIQSCVSVRVGVSSVTWARLKLPPTEERDSSVCQLSHWEHHEITEKKLHLADLVQRCLYMEYLIPAADCYILENPQMAQASNNPGNAHIQNVNIQKAQITAILSYALCARKIYLQEPALEAKEEKRPKTNVFYLRRFLSSRLFNQLVGNERISCENAIVNLMRYYYNTDEQQQIEANGRLHLRGNVQFPADFRHMFSQADRYQREFLGQALLLNLAFIRLVLLEDASSIAQVSRHQNVNMDKNREELIS